MELALSLPVELPYSDVTSLINKKKVNHSHVEVILKPLTKKTSQERLKKRIVNVLSSVPFSQYGYSKNEGEKYRQVMRDSDSCILLFYMEQLIKTFADDPLNTTFGNFIELLHFFDLFADETELASALLLKNLIITLTPTTVLHLWLQLSNRIFKLTDPSFNLEMMIEKRIEPRVSWIENERAFVRLILPHESVSEVIYREISYLQEVFLFIRSSPHLEFMTLLTKTSSYLQAIHHPIDHQVLKYQLILSMPERKTEFQPVQTDQSSILIGLPDLIEFLLRVSWLVYSSSPNSLTLATMYGSVGASQNFSCFRKIEPTSIPEIAEMFGTMIHGIRTFLLPDVEKLGLKELHKNLYMCTLENMKIADSD